MKKETVFSYLKKRQGVGDKSAKDLCQEWSILPLTPYMWLTEDQKLMIRRGLDVFMKENPFESMRNRHKLFKDLGMYRGVRASKGLPLRGQRTHSNGRTARKNLRRLNLNER